jgi:polynucleotide 5'-hydroxyl-kinase GRC3/NOL9
MVSTGMIEEGAGPTEGEDQVPDSWGDAIRRMVQGRASLVLVVGPPDAGKSTFCRGLMREAYSREYCAELLDTDLGQKMVGPPACVTLGEAAPNDQVALKKLGFVGTTDPVKGWHSLLDQAKRLADASIADLLLINTSGLLSGPGDRLKLRKIEVFRPDLVVTIGEHDALDRILDGMAACSVVRLPKSPHARRKTEGQRRAARRNAFRHHFADASEADILVSPSAFDPIPISRLLVGLSDGSGQDLGLGIVTKLDPSRRVVTCLTSADPSRVQYLRQGSILLNDDFDEVGCRKLVLDDEWP